MKLTYPIIGAMVILFVLYMFGRRKYQRLFMHYRSYLRDELVKTNFKDRISTVQSTILPDFRWSFLKAILLLNLTGLFFYTLTLVAPGPYNAISFIFGIFVLKQYFQSIYIDPSRLLIEYLDN